MSITEYSISKSFKSLQKEYQSISQPFLDHKQVLNPLQRKPKLTPISSVNPSPGPQPPNPEVTWQTCIWILITLALNTMFQPCGRVCNTHSYYKTYLRSSPFVCLADLLSILIRLLYISLRFQVSPISSLEMLLVERWSHGLTWNEVVDAKRGVWVRWLLFILGPLPQAIRLLSFRGFLWTKVFGFSYLASFLVFEVFMLVASVDKIKGRWRPWSADEERHGLDDRYEKTLERLNIMDWWLKIIAIATVPVGIYGSGVVLGFDSIWRFITSPDSYDGPRRVVHIVLSFYFACLMVPLGSILAMASILLLWMLLFTAIQSVYEKYPKVGRTLLLIPSEEMEIYGAVEESSWSFIFWNFCFFILNLVTCVVGYAYKYDPSGTENPGWTAVFG